MDRVMKISSNQSGALTGTKNLVDFDIPAGMVYDLSKSYMVIHSSIETTDTNATASGNASGGIGVYNCFLNYNDGTNANRNFKNKHLVKNVSMYSQKAGMVEDIKRSDVLQFNLDQFRDDVDTKVNASYDQISSLNGANAENGIRWSPHRRFSPEGTESSDNLEREIRIDLNELMNSCNNVWDGNKYGNTRVHAELNLAQLEIAETLNAADSIWAATDGGSGVKRNAVDADAGGGAKTSIVMSRIYDDEEDHPFYINQKITFTGTIGATNVGNYVRQITQIDHLTSGKIQLTFDSSIATGAISDGTALNVKGCDAASSSVSYDSAELVLYVTNQPAPPQIAFDTYKTEEDSFSGGGNNYNHQYYLESDCQNVFWGARASDKVLGFEQKINTYRIREAGEDKTDRDVTHGSSTHNYRLSRAFANSNMNVNNYSQAVLNNANRVSHLLSANGTAMDIPVYMIAETTQVSEMPKLLDVNIVANAGFTNITLFKQMTKVM